MSSGALALSMLSHGMRFLANAVLLMLLARLWAPEIFGTFAYANALAAIFGLVCGWGFSQQVMRGAAADPAKAGGAVGAAVLAQATLAPILVLVALAASASGFGPRPLLLMPLLGAFIALNLAETAAAACRGIGRFDAEARASAIGNGAFFAAGAVAALASGDAVVVAWAMLAGRVVHMIVAHRILFGAGVAVTRGAGAPVRSLRVAAAFAGEAILTGAFLQIDTVTVKLILGAADAGAYQAGVRFVVVALVVAQALAGLHIPALVRLLDDPDAFARRARRVMGVFAALGLGLFGTFALWGDSLALLVYGPHYVQTAALAPLFGTLVCLRCLAAGAGIVLLAAGAQVWRFVGTFVALAAYLAGAAAIGPAFGLAGLVWVNLGALLLLFALYLFKALPLLRVS